MLLHKNLEIQLWLSGSSYSWAPRSEIVSHILNVREISPQHVAGVADTDLNRRWSAFDSRVAKLGASSGKNPHLPNHPLLPYHILGGPCGGSAQ